MKRTFSLIFGAFVFPLLGVAQIRLDPSLMQAGLEAINSATLTNAQVVEYSRQAVKEMDAKNPVAAAADPYTQRLTRIVRRHHTVGGLPLNYKVYKVPDVNAFATADGSVRVFKGLMDIMSDEELLAIMGHEIGHVINKDSRDAMKSSLRRSAVRNAAAAQSGSLGQLARSQVGGLADYLLGASFSRRQETEADDYSYGFLKRNGYNVMALATSFEKLAKLSGGKESRVTAIISTHPTVAPGPSVSGIGLAGTDWPGRKRIGMNSRCLLFMPIHKAIAPTVWFRPCTIVENHSNRLCSRILYQF